MGSNPIPGTARPACDGIVEYAGFNAGDTVRFRSWASDGRAFFGRVVYVWQHGGLLTRWRWFKSIPLPPIIKSNCHRRSKMKKCSKCGIPFRYGTLCQTCAKYMRNGGVWHPLPAFGTVSYDDQGRPICHVCGMAMDKLIEHTKRKHGLDSAAYREAFGLMRKSARLTSPEYADKMRDHAEDYQTWMGNFHDVHAGIVPRGHRNPHWSQQEIESRREQQSEKGRKRWTIERDKRRIEGDLNE